MRSLSIVKPGIIFGNIVTLSGGFFLASHEQGFHFLLYLASVIGMSCVIACGCILNNIIDSDIDLLMERTKNRVLAKGIISGERAGVYAAIVGVVGFLILASCVNQLTVLVSFIGLIVYVGTYSLWLKRRSIYGTLIGGISGAVPPVVGYTAASGRFDLAAILVFLILFLWQMPHFYAIAIYRLNDFKSAGIPVLPIKKGIPYTQRSMQRYIVAFTLVSVLPAILGYAGAVYGFSALILGGIWFALSIKKPKNARPWARKLFLYSILAITLLSIAMGF